MSPGVPWPAVLLVHHADAVGPEQDPQRPLSARGRAQAQWLADHAKRAGLRPDVIWHSGKLRARQTAEAFLVTCNPSAAFRLVRGLRPDDSPDLVRDALVAEEQTVVLVSHLPLLPALLEALIGDGPRFPAHGMVLLEHKGPKVYREVWRVGPPRV